MLVIIGSHALKYYGRLLEREPADYDLMSSEDKKGIEKLSNKEVIDWSYSLEASEPSNKIIYDYCLKHSKEKMSTPLGEATVAPLEILKLLKLSSASLNKNKDQFDLASLQDITLSEELEKVLQMRLEETIKKIKDQVEKQQFFNKYQVKRYFEHDDLHLFINSKPAYLKFIKKGTSTEIDDKIFFSLSQKERMELLFEEALVLTLERYFIPKVMKNPLALFLLAAELSKADNSFDPAVKQLNRLTSIGQLKDHPDWIASWGKDHYKEIFIAFKDWLPKAVDEISEDFWQKFL